MGTEENRRETDSGIEIKPVYTADDTGTPLEAPGEYPFVRGPYAGMYRVRPWTMRQYAGFATAEATNERFRYLLDRGQTGLSTALIYRRSSAWTRMIRARSARWAAQASQSTRSTTCAACSAIFRSPMSRRR